MRRKLWKYTLLAMLLLASLALTGCYIPADETSDNTQNLTVGSQNLPFQSLPPTATAMPTATPTTVVSFPTVAVNNNYTGGNVQTSVQTAVPNSGTMVTMAPVSTPVNTIGAQVTMNTAVLATATPIPSSAPANTANGGNISVVTATPKPTNTPKPTSSSLKVGSTGSEVKKVQQRLKDLGYYTGSVDGDFGEGTQKAVKAFQKANNLTADGVVGSGTLSKLNSNKAVAYTAKVTQKPAKATATPKKGTTTKATATPKKTATPTPKKTATPTPRPTATPNLTNARYLTIGSSGKDVKRLQQRLIDLGWMSGKVTGEYDSATQAAVMAFQKKSKLWDDGIAGPDTQAKLYSSSAAKSSTPASSQGVSLKVGSEGSDVRALQKKLKSLGYYTGSVDGSYGEGTAAAVKAFQQNNGLKADGVAGTGTLNKLYSADAVKKSAGTNNTGNTGNTTGTVGTTKTDNGATVQTNYSDVKYSSTGYATMREGDKSTGVKTLQEKLKSLGYYTGKIDGSYGAGTTRAVESFQRANGLKADGVAGPATQRKLYGSHSEEVQTYATLRTGDESAAVANLQYTLYELDYYDGTITGKYDDLTRDAVRAFQQNNLLTPVDGIAGNATLRKLYSSSARSAQEPAQSYTVLEKGSKGNDVVELQDMLCYLGYMDKANGKYDDKTVEAVKQFQQNNGLHVDGVAGAGTQKVLYGNSPIANY